MDCNHLVELVGSSIPTIIGALIAIIPLWIKNNLDKKEKLQNWFYEVYIQNSIDPLLTYMLFCRDKLFPFISKKDASLMNVQEIQYSHLYNLYHISKDNHPSLLIFFIRDNLNKNRTDTAADRAQVLIPALNLIIEFLESFRKDLLKVEIKHKSDISRITLSEKTSQALDEIKKWFENTNKNK